jgi:hypothetical protein
MVHVGNKKTIKKSFNYGYDPCDPPRRKNTQDTAKEMTMEDNASCAIKTWQLPPPD